MRLEGRLEGIRVNESRETKRELERQKQQKELKMLLNIVDVEQKRKQRLDNMTREELLREAGLI